MLNFRTMASRPLTLALVLCLPLAAHAGEAGVSAPGRTLTEKDLEPFGPKGPEAEAMKHVKAALAHAGKGEHEDAAKRWEKAAKADALAAPWLAAHAVEAWIAADEATKARDSLGKMPGDHPARARATLAVAEALLEDGKEKKARAVLGDPDDLPGSLEAAGLLVLAKSWGKNGKAWPVWRRLHLEYPATTAGDEAKAALSKAPEAMQTFTDAALADRVDALLAAHRNKQVIPEAEAILRRVDPKSTLGCRMRYALGRANRKDRNYRDAIDVLKPMVDECEDKDLVLKGLYLWGSASSIALKDPAIPVYERLVKDFPDSSYADDALFYIADLHIRAGRGKKARETLDRQAKAYPKGDYAGEALWRLFWLDFLDGKYAESLPALDRLVKWASGRAEPFDLERARYWRGRVLQKLGKTDEAVTAWLELVEAAPLAYHTMLAIEQLRTLAPKKLHAVLAGFEAPPKTEPGFSVTLSPTLADHPSVKLGLHLLRLGLPEDAARVLDRASGAAKDDDVLALALLLDAAGDAHRSHWLIRTAAKDFAKRWPEGDGWRIWRAAYPLAFHDLVTEAAEGQGVDKWLLQALIREESALDPAVVSWAGAVGLAQLMPYTAKDLARRIKYTGEVNREVLKDPAFNLKLSARYHRDLARQMKHPALSIASYNAGERTVGGWRKARLDWDLDAFVEAMTIGETRRYTRRVLRSYATYRYLWGSKDERWLRIPLKVVPK